MPCVGRRRGCSPRGTKATTRCEGMNTHVKSSLSKKSPITRVVQAVVGRVDRQAERCARPALFVRPSPLSPSTLTLVRVTLTSNSTLPPPRRAQQQTDSDAHITQVTTTAQLIFPAAFERVSKLCTTWGVRLFITQATSGAVNYELREPAYALNTCPPGVCPLLAARHALMRSDDVPFHRFLGERTKWCGGAHRGRSAHWVVLSRFSRRCWTFFGKSRHARRRVVPCQNHQECLYPWNSSP